MDERLAEHLKVGTRVVVPFGGSSAQMPIVTTATVRSEVGADQGFKHDGLWLEVDIAQGETLPQRYSVSELIGFLLPLAEVTHHEDGSITGTFPEGTVAP